MLTNSRVSSKPKHIRAILWQNFRQREDWRYVAERHELTGAGILNVTHYCAIHILSKQTRRLDLKGLEAAIQREYIKEGKIV